MIQGQTIDSKKEGVAIMTKKTTIAAFFASLVVALMLAFATAAYAAEPPESTDLYIHKHMLTNIAKAGEPGTGEEANVAAEPLNGVVFKIYRVDTTAGVPDAGKVYKVNADSLTLSVYDADGTTLLGNPYPLTLEGSVTTTGDGTALQAGLSEGIYVVVEDIGTSHPTDTTGKAVEVNVACAPFIVALPMTNAAGNGYLDEVHVYPKNGAIVIDKEVGIPDGDAVVVGSVVPYTITSTIPDDIKDSTKYAVTDQLDVALDLLIPAGSDARGAVQVTVPASPALASTDYDVSYTDRLLTVSFTSAGRAKLEGYISVKIAFDTTVNAAILADGDHTVGNDATLDFTNKDGIDFEADTGGEGPKIHTAGIQVTKLDQARAALSGATFKVATSEENAKAGRFLRLDPGTKVLYDYDTGGWNTLGTANDYNISPDNVGTFVGLQDKAGGVFQSYWVVETAAPAGYNLVATPFEVAFNGQEEDYLASLEVVNNKGFVLPVTGGMGTILFVAGGIVLLGTAAIIVIAPWKKRKANEAQK